MDECEAELRGSQRLSETEQWSFSRGTKTCLTATFVLMKDHHLSHTSSAPSRHLLRGQAGL